MMHSAIASHRPIDVLEPLAGLTGAFACTPNALSSWAMATGAGGRCIYARATRLSGSLAERARLLSRGGAVQINQARNARDRTLFDFIATRTAKPVTVPAMAIDKLPSFAVSVLDVLEAVAAKGMACPTNAQIAAALGGSSGQRVCDALKVLQAAGMVAVEVARTGHDGARSIRIIETGETLCAA